MADIVGWARRQGILCQGRGSAANSAVCYCLGVTEVDPERAEVLFERICRENGITARSTKPRSPTTTGEISEDCALVLHPSDSRAKGVPPYVTFRGFRGRLSPTRSTLTKARG